MVIGHSGVTEWGGDMGHIKLTTEDACSLFSAGQNWLGRVVGWIYGFHMPMFMALSGAVYGISTKRDVPFDNLIQKKTKRLVIPYFLSGLLWMFPIKIIAGFYSDNASILAALSKFLIAEDAMGHLWFLPALFWCFILSWFLERIAKKFESRYVVFLLSIILVQILSKFPLPNIFCLPRSLGYLNYFTAGYCFEEFRKKHQCLFDSFPVLIYIFIVSLIFVIFDFKCGWISNTVLRVLIDGILVISVSALLCKCKRLNNSNVVRVIGDNCILIYIFHDPLNTIIMRWSHRLIVSSFGTVVYYIIRIPGLIFMCFLLSVIFRKLQEKGKKMLEEGKFNKLASQAIVITALAVVLFLFSQLVGIERVLSSQILLSADHQYRLYFNESNYKVTCLYHGSGEDEYLILRLYADQDPESIRRYCAKNGSENDFLTYTVPLSQPDSCPTIFLKTKAVQLPYIDYTTLKWSITQADEKTSIENEIIFPETSMERSPFKLGTW